MRDTTVIPIDKNGNPIPVFIPDTSKTQAIPAADATTIASSTTFGGTTKTRASYTTADIFSGTNYMTFTSKLEGYPSENISIQIVDAGAALVVSISGYAITIAGANTNPTCLAIKTAFEANAAINRLVAVSYTDGTATLNSGALARTFLSGWSDGATPMILRVTSAAAAFIHVGLAAPATAAEIKMPLLAGSTEWIAVMPDEIVSCVGAGAVTGNKVYITPARRM
jgi:hypothetical protein